MPPLKQNHSWTTWLVRGPVLWPMVILVSLSSQMFLFFVVQLLNYLQFFENPWTAACQASLSFTISCRSLLRFRSIESVMPSHPLPSPSALALSLCQHQGMFQWVCSLHQVAKLLEFRVLASAITLPMNTQGLFPLGLTGFMSLQSKGLSRVFSSTTIIYCL